MANQMMMLFNRSTGEWEYWESDGNNRALVETNSPSNLTATPAEFTKTVADSATPEQLQSTETLFRLATLVGKNAARTNNTGTVYLGTQSGNDTQFIEIAPGEMVTLEVPQGYQDDFQNYYLDVDTNGDGVMVMYS